MEEVTILLVVRNEEKTIYDVLSNLQWILSCKLIKGKFVVLDGASTDKTCKYIDIFKNLTSSYKVKTIYNKEYKSYSECIMQGIEACDTEYIFFTDADGQYDVYDFITLYERRKEADMIIGNKYKRKDPIMRIVFSKVFHKIPKYLFRLPVSDLDCGFRIFNKKVANITKVQYLPYSIWTEQTILACNKRYRVIEIPIKHYYRPYGESRNLVYSIPKIVKESLWGIFKLWRSLH